MEKATRPFRDFAQLINRERAAHRERQRVRAAGQGVRQQHLWKARPGRRRDEVDPGEHPACSTRATARGSRCRLGHHLPAAGGDDLGPAARRAQRDPVAAARPCPRAVGATTDGFISDATEDGDRAAPPRDRSAAGSPGCAPSSIPNGSAEILEIKHQALTMLVARTRHGVTIEPFAGSDYFLARAGHRLEDADGASTTTRATRLPSRRRWPPNAPRSSSCSASAPSTPRSMVSSFISMSKQWEQRLDLLMEHIQKRVALCYDMKRRPLDPVDVDGMIQFQTAPWDDAGGISGGPQRFRQLEDRRLHRGAQDDAATGRLSSSGGRRSGARPMRRGRRSRTPW